MPIVPTHASGVDLTEIEGRPGPISAGRLASRFLRPGAELLLHTRKVLVTAWGRMLSNYNAAYHGVTKESLRRRLPYEPNAQPPIWPLCTAITASLPITETLARHGRWFATRPRQPPDRLGMALTARRPNYYPARQPRPRTRLDRDVAVAARQGDLASPGALGPRAGG